MKSPFILLFASLLSLSTLAQNDLRRNTTPEQRAENQTRLLTKQLALNPEQSRKLQALNLAWAQRLDSLRATGSRPERSEMQRIQQTHEANLKTLLTPEQTLTYDRIRTERREKRSGRSGARKDTKR